MRYSLFLAITFVSTLTSNAQQKNSEELVNKLEASGILRRTTPNTVEFYISKPSDTIALKKKYAALKNNNGEPYQVKYVLGKPTKKIDDPPAVNQSTPVEQVVTVKPSAVNDGCYSRIKVFSYTNVTSAENNNTRYSIFNWTVPAGVTKIKIEGWSAGGDGRAKIYTRLRQDQDSFDYVQGGGGGGGAYVFSYVDVTPGDELRIRIPGGGSNGALTIDFPKSSKGFLNVTCGRNAAKDAGNEIGYDGKGGRLENNTGVFSENTFFMRGADGEAAQLLNYQNATNNVQMQTGAFGAPRPLSSIDKYEQYLGDGGDAPKSVHGGRGGSLVQRVSLHGKDGGYPGGGGGGGLNTTYLRAGRGASGLLIVYF
jgi:hypothetical protein